MLANLVLALALLSPTAGGPALADAATCQTTLPITGMASYYGPGTMEDVYRNRIAMGQVEPCPNCAGYVAMRYPADIGRKVIIVKDGDIFGPYLVVDCSAPADLGRLIARGRIVEVSYEQALEWDMAGPVAVDVWEVGEDTSGR